ncbi:MAG: 50S ribosomal protein L29 [Candidatus Pacearchaeota archaeon]
MKKKDLKLMSEDERKKKLEELKIELIKARLNASKAGSSKVKEIKKMIARIITFNKLNKK